jgi:hypothetical protein
MTPIVRALLAFAVSLVRSRVSLQPQFDRSYEYDTAKAKRFAELRDQRE